MKPTLIKTFIILTALVICRSSALAQTSTTPASEADKEAIYTASIEDRAADIVKGLGLTNLVAAGRVHELLIAQYRVMRARDALINAQLKATGKEVSYPNRAEKLMAESKPLHDCFFSKLSELLTLEQIEAIKDKLTYNKVKVTLDAYAAIVPGLTDGDKAKILELLWAAREEAVDGGNAPEKSQIFQKYKDQINDYLNAHGHDVAKAYKEWDEKQAAAKTNAASSTVGAEPVQK